MGNAFCNGYFVPVNIMIFGHDHISLLCKILREKEESLLSHLWWSQMGRKQSKKPFYTNILPLQLYTAV